MLIEHPVIVNIWYLIKLYKRKGDFMNMTTKALLGVLILSGSLCARSSEETAFINAVRDQKYEVVDRLFTCVKTRRTYDKALRAAARNCDTTLFNKIAPFASRQGRRKAKRSLERRLDAKSCVVCLENK